ncbi:hypothetical protein AAFN85_28450 [Mucilaginibacter sp. CAU 1740]|uniref:hypothetical protein n=1 Tax=Mucilaginibacter sp. CAU 1740 TaxID=3140365 RepID=UPI00325A56EC
MDKDELIQQLELLIKEIDNLGNWSTAQGYNLERILKKWLCLKDESPKWAENINIYEFNELLDNVALSKRQGPDKYITNSYNRAKETLVVFITEQITALD